jgi:predicted nuclease of predicted toxin-antitoxin system
MRFVIDMNLSRRLFVLLVRVGVVAGHWAEVGDPKAADETILVWARQHNVVLITHDLDFGAILSATSWQSPSVLQARTEDTAPDHLLPILKGVIKRFSMELEQGALISVTEASSRARVLPL